MYSRKRSLLIALSACAFFLSSCGASKDKTVKVFDMGTRVEVGHLIYTVFETEWQPQIGAGDTARVPKNRFFLIRLSAVNSGSEELDVPNVTLVDDQGGTVDELQDGEQVPQWIGFVRKVKPADSISGNVVFDAAPKHYRLRVTDEDEEKTAMVDIPLNFNADLPPAAPAAPADFHSATKN
jgi:Domain of unknown function (DUF4352)